MSPEQARLSGLDIDTRTDIYSLGVLLDETPIWQEVYFFSDIDEATRENTGLSTQLGELYLDFQDVSQVWGKDGQLNLRAGRMFVPFGEEYLDRYAMENPLISHSLSDLWGIDPGVELYGTVGDFNYVVAVQMAWRILTAINPWRPAFVLIPINISISA